ncbi:MAG: hypothetical protein IRY98_10230 [Alicyclobacillaceae bacterium]|nr:hypothetical protein [Alicyclobacillaceae bacterium]
MTSVKHFGETYDPDHQIAFSKELKEAMDRLMETLERNHYAIKENPQYNTRIHYFPAFPTKDAPILAYLELLVHLRIGRRPAAPKGSEVTHLFRHTQASIRESANGDIELYFLYRTAPADGPPSWAKTVAAVQELTRCIHAWTREFEKRAQR